MSLSEDQVILVERAEHVGDYRLRLAFSDGTEQVVDFGPFLHGTRNPHIKAYLEPAKFSEFAVTQGDLMWGDHDLCFPVAALYEGRI